MALDFTTSCWFLAVLYILVGLTSFIQFIVLLYRDDARRCCVPKTVQQKAHCIVFLLCVIRTAFFFVAINSWNSEDGIVESNKVAFYSLDEFATVLFFSLTSILALFWAELYYIAIDKVYVFTNIVRPLTYMLNLVAFVAIAVCIYLVVEDFEVKVDYVYIQYSLLVAITYLLTAVIFMYYAHAAATELNQVPIQLSARKSRLRTLRILAIICISALVIRPIVVLAMTGSSLSTSTTVSLVAFILYYLLLELLPTVATITFYRVEIMDSSSNPIYGDYDQAEDWETTPLNNADHAGLDGNVATVVSSGSGNGSRKLDLVRDNSEDLVNSIIEKLSDNGSLHSQGSNRFNYKVDGHV